ncbi:hypothetical protein VTK26DRAFT_5170 [Humicola hyalothermophila]
MYPNRQARIGTPQPEKSHKKGPVSSNTNGPSADTETRKQPTYTTVGSIYKPKTMTQIQPPTRRPRIRHYPQPIRSSSGSTFFPFPNTLLSALPLESISPPTTASTLQQYCPLQQNCDRAATPVAERNSSAPPSARMTMPVAHPGNMPSTAPFEGNDCVGSEDVLASLRISTKALTNLASYPNPAQKAAQNKWAKARTANMGFTRPDSPSSLKSTTPDPAKDRPGNAHGTAPAVPNPPRPLTAGPPGHRAFKSGQLNALAKDFNLEGQVSQASPMVGVFQPVSSIGPQYNAGVGILPAFDDGGGASDADTPSLLPPDERYHRLRSFNPSDHPISRNLSTPGAPDFVAGVADGVRRKISDTLPPERARKYYPNGLPPNYDGRHKPVAENWHANYMMTDNNFMQEPSFERRSKINRSFYAGTEGLVKNMEQIVRDHNYRCLENKVGVIGEERERLRGSHIERLGDDGKIQPPYMKPEEVAGMDAAEVTQPMLNMLFATLLRLKEESQSGTSAVTGWPSGFVKADDSVVDSTEGGNMSFFTEPKEEQTKKKVPRKPRRGY